MDKILKFVCSFYTTMILGIIYASALAVATFIESDVSFGTPAAWDLVYGAVWFDILSLLIVLNLVGVFFYHKIYKSKKYHILLLHLAFIVILMGAAITRYFGFEGVMHIREGYSSNVIISQDEFITIRASVDGKIYHTQFPVRFSAIKETHFDENIPLLDSNLNVKFLKYTPAEDMIHLPTLDISINYEGESRELSLYQNYLTNEEPEIISINDTDFEIVWGNSETKLPFSIYLQDFKLDRYAGSMSPSSYSSDIVIKDLDGENSFEFKIFMNNVLDYRGYRFFQSSYDEDEKGTILSVNKDPGKIPTYIGYAMLIFGFLWSFFAKSGRFQFLSKYLKGQKLLALAFIFAMSIFTPNLHAYKGMENDQAAHEQLESELMESRGEIEPSEEDIKRVMSEIKANMANHSKDLGKLLVQDFGGRIKPLDTQASEIVHKITGKDGFFGLNNVEILLGMMTYYDAFQRVKMFSTKTEELREILGTPKNEKYIAFVDVFDDNKYKLGNYIEEANRKNPAQRNNLEKDIIKLDEKINLAYVIFTAEILKIFPNITQGGKEWLSPADAIVAFSQDDARKVQNMLQDYFSGVDRGVRNNAWSDATYALNQLKSFQTNNAEVLPKNAQINMEILLNHFNPFKNLGFIYILSSVILFIIVLIGILKSKQINAKLAFGLYVIIVLSLILHTISLAFRWYVGGHAPWSNAYESMLYIAWSGGVAGCLFFRKSYLALSMAGLLAGITLFVANLGFMDPQITNLVPVLKSYWLNIHVSVITASYGFFGLCFMLGIIGLVLFILRTKENPQIDQTILNLHCINELSMLLGLALLSIGNFLGGVWANESWGRYWGWDSKETWSLISIVIYAIIIHARFIKKLNSPFAFAALSTIGFYAILMTYYGVNFYLTGKHSYASGAEDIVIPTFVYVLVLCNLALIALAAFKRDLKGV